MRWQGLCCDDDNLRADRFGSAWLRPRQPQGSDRSAGLRRQRLCCDNDLCRGGGLGRVGPSPHDRDETVPARLRRQRDPDVDDRGRCCPPAGHGYESPAGRLGRDKDNTGDDVARLRPTSREREQAVTGRLRRQSLSGNNNDLRGDRYRRSFTGLAEPHRPLPVRRLRRQHRDREYDRRECPSGRRLPSREREPTHPASHIRRRGDGR